MLIKEIKTLEESKIDNNDAFEKLDTKKEELELLRQAKLRGNVLRSKVQWITEGEKPSKFFCNLEAKNFSNKIIPKIIKENGKILNKQQDIMKEVKSFYENLYSSNDSCRKEFNLETELENIPARKLSNEQSDRLEGLINYEEAKETLKNMKNDKSPGSSGFTTEFFKMFWGELGHFVVRSINYGYDHGQLSITQRQGIITCLPKGDKPRHFLKNWRPITLLNVSYKIASGTIANRIKGILQN